MNSGFRLFLENNMEFFCLWTGCPNADCREEKIQRLQKAYFAGNYNIPYEAKTCKEDKNDK